MEKFTIRPLEFDAKLLGEVEHRARSGKVFSTSGIAKELKVPPGKVAMALLIINTPRKAIDDPAKLARAVAKDRKAGASWGLLAARYGVTEGTCRAAFTAATGTPFSSLDYRKKVKA